MTVGRIAIGISIAWMLLAQAVMAQDGYLVQVQNVADRKAVFATLESVDTTTARARIAGTISELSVDEGDPVREGDRIAVVVDEKLSLEIRALEARIRSLRAQEGLAATDLDRARTLRQSGTATQARLDEAESRLAVLRAEIAAMEAELAVAVERQAEGAVLAPAAGRVIQVRVVEDVVVLAGEPIAEIAAELYILRMRLPERHARFVKIGDRVLVGARGLQPDAEPLGEGVVRQVYPELEDGRVVADVEIGGLENFFVGERVRVYVSTGSRPAILVPSSYVFDRFGTSFVRLEDGRDVVVQTGLGIDGDIEILSGLRPGDRLAKP